MLLQLGQVDSPESRGMLEVTEMTKNFHKSDQTRNQTKRDINKLCVGKVSLEKTVRINLSADSGFSNVLYVKNQNVGNTGNQQAFLNQKNSQFKQFMVTRKLLKKN